MNARVIRGCQITQNNSVHVGCEVNKNTLYLSFEVSDSGKGIPAEKLYIIFDEKVTDDTDVNWDDTGMGLSICKYICTKIEGFIKYSSVVNQYTNFNFYIP